MHTVYVELAILYVLRLVRKLSIAIGTGRRVSDLIPDIIAYASLAYPMACIYYMDYRGTPQA
jgi:hypothetical protein